jgi:hypothetical protein
MVSSNAKWRSDAGAAFGPMSAMTHQPAYSTREIRSQKALVDAVEPSVNKKQRLTASVGAASPARTGGRVS